MKWLKRTGIFLAALLVAAVVLAAVFISPITKYLIEKYSKPVIGRQVSMEGLFLNFFSGSMSITDLKVYEPNDKDVFFYCHKISSNITVKKMLQGEYEINEMKFVNPEVIVYQDGNNFSYDDIVAHLLTADTTNKNTAAAPPVKFWLRNIQIDSGYIKHINVAYKDTTEIMNLRFMCPSYAWDNPELLLSAAFTFGSGGDIDCSMQLDTDSLDYVVSLNSKDLDVKKYYKSLNSMMHIGGLDGLVNATLRFRGNFNELENLAASGMLSLDRVFIRDTTGTDFVSFNQFQIQVDSLNVKESRYDFHRILLDRPYFKFDLYDNGNNISKMLVASAAETATAPDSTAAATDELDYTNIFTLMGSYVKLISKDYLISNYSADSIILREGHFLYNDYTLEDRFSYDIENANFVSGKINSQNDSIIIRSAATFNQSGKLTAYLAATPDFKNFRMNFDIRNMKVSDMNPYSRFYVATPFLDGTLDYTSQTTITDGMLNSSNKISVVQLTAGRKISDKPLYNVPVRLAVSLLKDVHGNINLDIPVEGDLNDPEYKIGKVIWQIVENIIVKAATAPFRLLANMFGGSEEDMKQIPFNYLQKELDNNQFKKLDQVADVLTAKTEMMVELKQVTDTFAEREQWSLFEAKRKYYESKMSGTLKDSLSEEDIVQINSIANKDSLFNAYLNQQLQLSAADLLPTQEKCLQLIGAAVAEQQVKAIMNQRNEQVISYLTTIKSIAADRIRVLNNHDYGVSNGISQPVYLVNYLVEE